jgi:L-ascorbate metabolism protein UlaG (beta-lactamase superfamily)
MFQIKIVVLVVIFLLPLFFSVAIINNQSDHKEELEVEIKWLGWACFYIKNSQGIRIVNDPFCMEMVDKINKTRLKDRKEIIADIITVSHEHRDHNAVDEVNQVDFRGADIIREVGEKKSKGIVFRGIGSYHDKIKGQRAGPNTIFVFTVDGITFCHLGDLGHMLSEERLEEIGKVDVLFIPVGGKATINAKEATVLLKKMKPKIAIPMHYRQEKANANWTTSITSIDDFLKGKKYLKLVKSEGIELSANKLPKKMEIIVLDAE